MKGVKRNPTGDGEGQGQRIDSVSLCTFLPVIVGLQRDLRL